MFQPGTSFNFFWGGQNFDRFPKGGQNMKKKKLCAKAQKITIFLNQGGGVNAPPPQMTSLVSTSVFSACLMK